MAVGAIFQLIAGSGYESFIFPDELRANKIIRWPCHKDPYKFLHILTEDHLHLFLEQDIRRILTSRKRRYDFDIDITIVCHEFSRDYE